MEDDSESSKFKLLIPPPPTYIYLHPYFHTSGSATSSSASISKNPADISNFFNRYTCMCIFAFGDFVILHISIINHLLSLDLCSFVNNSLLKQDGKGTDKSIRDKAAASLKKWFARDLECYWRTLSLYSHEKIDIELLCFIWLFKSCCFLLVRNSFAKLHTEPSC